MHVFVLLPIVALFAGVGRAGSVSQGGSCSTDNDRLDPATHKFLSDCDGQTFCSSATNGTCQTRQCRRDEFPFGYQAMDALPQLCSRGTFCPDEGSGCQTLVPVGGPCQLNRDDQCAPPQDWTVLAGDQNFNGSLCLQLTCAFANATLGQRCILDNSSYIDFGPDGQQFSNTIVRHNCQTPNFYCDPAMTQCLPTKSLGTPCQADQECQTFSCSSAGLCTDPPEMPFKVKPWKYAIIVFTVIFAMFATGTMLVKVHKRHRLQRYHELHEYYEEQISLRHSMFALHSAAADRFTEAQKRLNRTGSTTSESDDSK